MARAERAFSPINYMMRFPALDGIRALAVVMVFAFHYGGGTHGGSVLRLVNSIRLRGWMGVDMFFVLSGFLITGILYDTRSDRHYFKRFFARRSIRIFPIFYLVFCVLLLLTPLLQYQWRLGHLWYLVYLGNVALGFDPSLREIASSNHPLAAAHLEHFWTLCVEEQFYLLWPLVIWKVRDRRRLIWIAVGLILTALALRTTVVLHLPLSLHLPWRFDESVMMHMLPYRMDSLLMGALLALVLRGEAAQRWQRACTWVFPMGAAVVIGICTLSPDPDSPWLLTIGVSAIAMSAAGLIGATVRMDSFAFSVFNLHPLRVLGRVSYGFYVYHVLWPGTWAGLTALLTFRLHSSVLGNAISLSVAFGATLLVSLLSYNLFEKRFLRLKERFEYDSELTEQRHAFETE
jgi:peptidoglycan/LPS O-acetylase OafA/YrhL